MTSRYRVYFGIAWAALALIGLGCSRETPTEPERPQSTLVSATPAVAQIQEQSGDIPVTERFQVSVRTAGGIRVGAPLAVTLEVIALHATEAAELALQVPELEQLTATGTFRGHQPGRKDSPSLVWRGRLAAGERISRTVQIRFPRAGYYTVLGTARKTSLEQDTAWVSSGASDVWYAHVERSTGKLTRDIDKTVYRPGFVPGPGPFRVRGPGGAMTMSECTEITDPNCFPPPGDPPPGPRACCVTLEYMHVKTYTPYTIAPAPGMRVSLFFETEEYTGITDVNGRVTGLPCPRTGGEQGTIRHILQEPGKIVMEDLVNGTGTAFFYGVNASWCNQTTQILNSSHTMMAFVRLLKVHANAQALFGRSRTQLPFRIIYTGSSTSKYDRPEDRVYMRVQHIDDDFGLFAVAHEYGHAYMARALVSGFQGGNCPQPHFLHRGSGLTCAYSEGFADFFSAATQASLIAANIERNDWRLISGGEFGPNVEGAVAGYLLDIIDPVFVSTPIENDPTFNPASGLLKTMDYCIERRYDWPTPNQQYSSSSGYVNILPELQHCLHAPSAPPVTPVHSAPYPQYLLRGELSQAIALPPGWSNTTLPGLYAWNITYTGR